MTDHPQAIIPTSHLDLLTSTALANVATIGPDDAPQVNPVRFRTQLSLNMTDSRAAIDGDFGSI